jgi:hypothetical protein
MSERDIRARNREYRRDQEEQQQRDRDQAEQQQRDRQRLNGFLQEQQQYDREIQDLMQQERQLRERRARIHHKLRIREERGVRIVPRSWGALFKLLLLEVLRTQRLPLYHQNDLWFMDETGGDDDDYFNIRSREEHRLGRGRRGNSPGLLCIMLNSNDPNYGHCRLRAGDDPRRVDDWSVACTTRRRVRISMYPPAELFLNHFIETLPPLPDPPGAEIQRFNHPALRNWNHCVFRTLNGAGRPKLSVFHMDQSISLEVVSLVAMAIIEHYRLVDGGEPHDGGEPPQGGAQGGN